jgi:hypothetical protein
MKINIFLLTFLLIGFVQVKSQTIKDNLSLDLNVGTRLLGNTSDKTKLIPGIHVSGGLVKSVSKLFSIKGELAIDSYHARDVASKWESQIKYANISDRSVLVRANLIAGINLVELAKINSDKFVLNLNAGVGLGSNFNKDYRKEYPDNFSGLGLKGNDNMPTVLFGLNPKFNVSPRVSFAGEISYALLLKQSYYIDRSINSTLINGNDNLLNISLGISVKLNK